MIITIDGPGASGKSSVARAVAQHFNFYYLNTGLLYRAVAYILYYSKGYSIDQMTNLSSPIVNHIITRENFNYSYDSVANEQVIVNKKNITLFLKDQQIDFLASIISSNPAVRSELLAYQRSFALKNNIVVDGRDCGSIVFPDAEYKFFLTASLEIRAERWQQDQMIKGNIYTLEQSIDELGKRDLRDKERKHSPLKIPDKAFVVDNSTLSLAETIDIIIKKVECS